MSRNIFSQQHYVAVANLLGKAVAQNATLEQVINDFRTLFAEDYPPTNGTIWHFNDKRFREAIAATVEAEKEKQQEQLREIMIKVGTRRDHLNDS